MIILIDIYDATALIQVMDGLGIDCAAAIGVPTPDARRAIDGLMASCFPDLDKSDDVQVSVQVRRMLGQAAAPASQWRNTVESALSAAGVANG